MAKNRLSKVLASAGVASRRKCEELIFSKKVKVNGKVIDIPQHMVDIEVDKILVDNKPIVASEPKVYYILNKPKGYVCANDRRYKNIVLDLLPKKERLFTVGRLDKETMGLIIVTNDGHLAHRIIHPSFEIEKEYIVKTNSEILPAHLEQISQGISIEKTYVKPSKVEKVRKNTVKIIVQEGKKREVRALVEQTGLIIEHLERIRIGNLRLGHLPMGHYKQVTLKELETIFDN